MSSQKQIDFEKIIRGAQHLSLKYLMEETDYKFAEICSRVLQVTRNGGGIERNGKTFGNKCFFRAFSDGLKQIGINAPAYDLAEMCGRLNNVDTDIEHDDKESFKKLVEKYGIRLRIYLGIEINGFFYVSRDPPCKEGSCGKIIRILHIPGHFEHLVEIEGGFIDDNNEASEQAAILHQFEVQAINRQTNRDHELAKKVALGIEIPEDAPVRDPMQEAREEMKRHMQARQALCERLKQEHDRQCQAREKAKRERRLLLERLAREKDERQNQIARLESDFVKMSIQVGNFVRTGLHVQQKETFIMLVKALEVIKDNLGHLKTIDDQETDNKLTHFDTNNAPTSQETDLEMAQRLWNEEILKSLH